MSKKDSFAKTVSTAIQSILEHAPDGKKKLMASLGGAIGAPPEQIVVAVREGTQLKLNAMWQGDWSPSKAERRPLAVAIANDGGIDRALEGAINRLTMLVEYPEAIVVFSYDDGAYVPTEVVGYTGSQAAKEVANRLGFPDESIREVDRPHSVEHTPVVARGVATTDLYKHFAETPNIVLQGPPGTGKTAKVLRFLADVAGGIAKREECNFGHRLDANHGDLDQMIVNLKNSRPPLIWEMIQLHPGYSYDDLVRRITPRTQNKTLRFEIEDQLLPQLCRVAQALHAEEVAEPSTPVVLVLDEFNRTDISSVLGEFLFAIDRDHRGTAVRLQYQGDGLEPAIAVPANLLLLGTMNTADRSISAIDYAVRRRFRFLDVLPDRRALEAYYADAPKRADITSELLAVFNTGIEPRYGIGHAYLLVEAGASDDELWAARLSRRVAYEAWPMLREYHAEGLSPARALTFRGVDLPTDEAQLAMTLRSLIFDELAGE